MTITVFDLAQRYIGLHELTGRNDHPLIQWWLSLCGRGFAADAWCSAFVNGMAWELRLPRSKSAAARSWLTVGQAIPLEQAMVGFDVVVLSRGAGNQPGPDVLNAQGHVGFFAGQDGETVQVLGGNQGNAVSVEAFPTSRILGIRRIGEV